MTDKFVFHWELKHFLPFILNSANQGIKYSFGSEIFFASTKETNHTWQTLLKLNTETKKYHIFLELKHAKIPRPISVQCHFELLDFKGSLFHKTFTAHKTIGEGTGNFNGWGFLNQFTFDTICQISLGLIKPIHINAILEVKDSKTFYSLHDHHFRESKLFEQYKDEKYCDLTINCGERTFKAHKVILASTSPAFQYLLTEKCEETDTGTLLIVNDISPDVLEDLLEFVYTGKLSMDFEKAKKLLEAGAKFQLANLQEICLRKIEGSLSVPTAVEILTIFDEYRSSGKEGVMSFIKSNIAEIVNSAGWKEIMAQRFDLMDAFIRYICNLA